MKPLAPLLLALLIAFPGCGGEDGETSTDATSPADVSDVAADGETTPEPVTKAFKEVTGASVEGVKGVLGFGCNEDWLYVNVDGLTAKGLYAWAFDQPPALEQAFGGIGPIKVLNSGVLVASFDPASTTAVVGVDPEGTATDMGFTFPGHDVRFMSYTGTHLVTLSKDWAVAEYLLHRAKLPDGGWEGVGPRLNETGISMFATPSSVYVLTILNEVVGVGCHTLPLTSGEETPYEDCPSFPDYVDNGGMGTEPYSVSSQVYGSGEKLGLWFRVSDKGEQEAHHYVASDKIKWTRVEGFPAAEPTAWHHDGEHIYIGLTNAGGASAAWRAPADGSEGAEDLGLGLPGTTEKSGVAGLCTRGNLIYAAWFDYNPGGSTVQIHVRSK